MGFYFNGKTLKCMLLRYNPETNMAPATQSKMLHYCAYLNPTPTASPTSAPPVCNDIPYKVYTIEGKKRPCGALTRESDDTLNDICANTDASEVCPDTCARICICTDDRTTLFKPGKKTRTCLWLSWMKKFSVRAKFCRRIEAARDACPGVCSGWCLWGKQ